jgi:uncharacterized protein (DUF433 family)
MDRLRLGKARSMKIGWSRCADVETRPDVMSGAPVVRGTRVPAQALIDNADDGYTAEQIVKGVFLTAD